MRKRSYWLVDLSATVFIGWGALGTLADIYSKHRYSAPLDIGLILGNAGITAAGLVAAAVTRSLGKIEDRLQKLETLQSLESAPSSRTSPDRSRPTPSES